MPELVSVNMRALDGALASIATRPTKKVAYEPTDMMLVIVLAPPTHPDEPWEQPPGWEWVMDSQVGGNRKLQHVHMAAFWKMGPEQVTLEPSLAAGPIVNDPVAAAIVIRGATRIVGAWGQPSCQEAWNGLCNGEWHDNVKSPCYESGCGAIICQSGQVGEPGLAVWAFACHDQGAPLLAPGQVDTIAGNQGVVSIGVDSVSGSVPEVIAMPKAGSNWGHGVAIVVVVA